MHLIAEFCHLEFIFILKVAFYVILNLGKLVEFIRLSSLYKKFSYTYKKCIHSIMEGG